ncbi:MAG: nucleoside triphosphate pyrophosphatase [Solirubrobacterales bacterium]|jgi:septum formation protein|nr:nucleoside triphosphate pyrophosphatase [Solirubrobacterales bacterium]
MSGSRESRADPALRVVLASSSPQRREILRKLGIEFEVVVPGVEELSGGDPEVEVVENARMKARAVEVDAGALVIACDTDVALDGKALGKPADQVEAREYLDRMSGRSHEVLSGLVVLAGGEELSGLERTTVVFKQLSEAEKERYVRFGEWRGRSGGYAVQTLGSTLVERLEGSVSNVVGLPVGLLAELAPQLFESPSAS